MANYFNADYYFAAKAKQLSNIPGGKTYTAAEVKTEFAKLGISAEDHYKAYGQSENLNPNAYFNEAEYLATKLASLQENAATKAEWTGKTVAQLKTELAKSGLSAAEHYEQFGAFETRADGTLLNPSNAFDANAFFSAKLAQLQDAGYDGADKMTVQDVVNALKGAGLSPVSHFQSYGAAESKTDGVSMVQTVPVGQRVANDANRAALGELVPGNYNQPSKGPASAVAGEVTKPADMGGLSAAAPKQPSAPVKTPADAGFVAPPDGLLDTADTTVIPPTGHTGSGPNNSFIIVGSDGKGTVVNKDGKVQGTIDKVETDANGNYKQPPFDVIIKGEDGKNTNTNPADDNDQPVPPQPDPTPDPDPVDPPAPVAKLVVTYNDETTPTKATVKFENAPSSVTVTIESSKYVLTAADGTKLTLKTDSTTGTFEIDKNVTLKGNSTVLSGKTITAVGANNAGKVEITDAKTGDSYAGIHADLDVTAKVASNFTYSDTDHKIIDTFEVADTITLTGGTTAQMNGKAFTGAGTVTMTDAALAANTTIDASKMVSGSSISSEFTEGTSAFTLDYKGGSGVDTLTLKAQTTNGDYSNLKLVADLGAGDDVINLGIGSGGISFADGSTLNGGTGTDTLKITGTASGNGVLTFHDDNSLVGIEKIDLSAVTVGSQSIGINLSNQTEGFAEVKGSSGGDYIAGGSGVDTIYGGSGADWIRGGDGDDIIYASSTASGADSVATTNIWIAKSLGGANRADASSLNWDTSTNDNTSGGVSTSDFWITKAARTVLDQANVLEAGNGADTMYASAAKDVFLFQQGGDGDRTDEATFDGKTNTIHDFDVATDKLMIMDQDAWNNTAATAITTGQRGFSTLWKFDDSSNKLTINGAEGVSGNDTLTWGSGSGADVKIAKEANADGTTFDYTITISDDVLALGYSGSDTLVIKLVGLADSLFDSAANLNKLFGSDTVTV